MQRFAPDPTTRALARVQHRALLAQRALLFRIAWQKLRRSGPSALLSAASWDPDQDFGPALLHAERLTLMLGDAAIGQALSDQARRHPHRKTLLERYLERADPRSRDLLHRIRQTGAGLLARLEALEPS